MLIAGFQPFTLSDFPGHVAAIVFTQGCNLRCPFCHNGPLIPVRPIPDLSMPHEKVFGFLRERAGMLEGLVVSGGEPTIHAGLPEFLRAVRALGYRIKLDTNGTNPDMLCRLFEEGLLDYVAMDVKAPLTRYSLLAGRSVDTNAIARSVRIIAQSAVPHEFRTTVVTPLLNEADLDDIERLLPAGSRHKRQEFRAELALDASLRANPRRAPATAWDRV